MKQKIVDVNKEQHVIMKNTNTKILRMECTSELKVPKLFNYTEVLICIEMQMYQVYIRFKPASLAINSLHTEKLHIIYTEAIKSYKGLIKLG